jgi:hypothetical protein
MEGMSCLNRVPRFVEPIEMRQRGSEMEMRKWGDFGSSRWSGDTV